MQQMAAATVDKIVLEKFGSKSMRIFRYIRWVWCGVTPPFQLQCYGSGYGVGSASSCRIWIGILMENGIRNRIGNAADP
jgi:hypothetical protein